MLGVQTAPSPKPTEKGGGRSRVFLCARGGGPQGAPLPLHCACNVGAHSVNQTLRVCVVKSVWFLLSDCRLHRRRVSCYFMLRNSASGPEIGLRGWISVGILSGKPQTRRPSGRPMAGGPILMFFRLESGRYLTRKSDSLPEALLHNIGHLLVSSLSGRT